MRGSIVGETFLAMSRGEEVNIRIHDHSDIHFNDSLHVHSIVLCIAVFLGLTIMQLCSL